MDKIFDINNTNFSLEVREFINKVLLEKDDWLNEPQRILHDVFFHLPRGLLAYLKMGTGKTRLAVACALSSGLPVVLISNKGLMADFNKKIEKIRAALLAKGLDTSGLDKFSTLSLNAGNLLTQIDRLDPLEPKVFDGKMVIVDEAHHFFNGVTNQSKNHLGLYRALMAAIDCKIMFLTGTPIVKSTWEMVPCFNILAGYQLLPESEEDFFALYGEGRNRVKLENRLSGLIAYYEIPPALAAELLPTILPQVIKKIEMSKAQFSVYLNARTLEQEETKAFGQKGKSLRQVAGKKMSSSYRAKSRRICNFFYGDGMAKFDPELLTDEDCSKMHIYGPKVVEIFKDIEATKMHNQYCFSIFKSSGIFLLARYARYLGWEEVVPQPLSEEIQSTMPKSILAKSTPTNINNVGAFKYGMLHGGMTIEEREYIVACYNGETNTPCSLLFITISGAEGFDFKRSRYCRFLDYFFHTSIIDQIAGRGPRIDAYKDMKKEDRTFQVYVYLMKVPDDYIKEVSTDQFMYDHAQEGAIEPKEMMEMYKRIAVNCQGVCKICSPTNKILYYPNINDDMLLENPCVPPESVKKKVSEVDYNGEKYYYDEAKNIIRFDAALNMYVYLNINDPVYHIIYNSL